MDDSIDAISEEAPMAIFVTMLFAGACSAAILGVLTYTGRSALYVRGRAPIGVYPMLAICAVGGLLFGGLIGLIIGRLVLALGSVIPAFASATCGPWRVGFVSFAVWPGGIVGGAFGMLLGFITADAKNQSRLMLSRNQQQP